MEVDSRGLAGNVNKSQDFSISPTERNEPTEKELSTLLFINHAATTWHESRRKWIGDPSQHPKRMAKEPVISWSTTYEELLSTSDPFSEPIPLTEMVDFLVDIWHDEEL